MTAYFNRAMYLKISASISCIGATIASLLPALSVRDIQEPAHLMTFSLRTLSEICPFAILLVLIPLLYFFLIFSEGTTPNTKVVLWFSLTIALMFSMAKAVYDMRVWVAQEAVFEQSHVAFAVYLVVVGMASALTFLAIDHKESSINEDTQMLSSGKS